MSGFDNGTLQGGIFAQAKQFGSILRGFGPPVPTAGVVGDLYMDDQTGFLYEKTDDQATNPWSNYLYAVPVQYRDALKWFATIAPSNDFGVTGDYCLLFGGYANYGLQPSIFGPKAAYGWPELGSGPDTVIDPLFAGYALQVGLEDEGPGVLFSTSTQTIVVGLTDEYILAMPVNLAADDPVSQTGVAMGPLGIAVDLNPIYPAVNSHEV